VRHRPSTAFRRGLCALLVCVGLAASGLAAAGGKAPRDPAADVLQIARQQLGDPYAWGATGPDSWDCSGLTSYLWREVGGVADIPRVARDQQAWAVPIPREQLLVGDLVFFGDPVTHVALYAGKGLIVDASSSRHGVVQRALWTTGVIRYGRVPRPGMPKVTPWTPPAPKPDPTPSATPAPDVTASAGAAEPEPDDRPAAAVAVTPLRGLPAPDLPAPSALAARAAHNAQTVRGSRAWTDLGLVREAWRHAGGGQLPTTRSALEAAATAVPLASVRIGDLVLYGRPAEHVGVYLGHGYMIDASPSYRKVVVRRVFSSPTVRFVRPAVH
jgi:cell wall-associated NlpC family hydrolase